MVGKCHDYLLSKLTDQNIFSSIPACHAGDPDSISGNGFIILGIIALLSYQKDIKLQINDSIFYEQSHNSQMIQTFRPKLVVKVLIFFLTNVKFCHEQSSRKEEVSMVLHVRRCHGMF